MDLGDVLAALANKMEPKDAAEIARRGAHRLAAALENAQDPFELSILSKALAALANRMEPQAAAEIAKGLLAAALEDPQETDSDRVSSLGEVLAALANRMEPQAAAEIARRGAQRLVAALEKETDSSRLSSLGDALAALCRLLPSSARSTRLLAVSNMLLSNMPLEPERKLLGEVCAQLSREDLADVLKYPFCTGETEQVVLDQLQAKTQRDFGGDVWKFVEQANSLDIKEVDIPAKRPSVREVLAELAPQRTKETERLWGLRAKDPAAKPVVLRGHEDAVNAVAIGADSRWVVTGSYDDTARLWDLRAKDPAANSIVLRGTMEWSMRWRSARITTGL